MKALDRILQRWRIAKARRFIPRGAAVLDVGCAEGELFLRLRDRIAGGVGVDPTLARDVEGPGYRLIAGRFPDDVPADARFDAITMLAVLEHLPSEAHAGIATACERLLRPGGRVVATVPQPAVDHLLRALRAARLVDGMVLEEHHGFDPRLVPRIFARPAWAPVVRRRFQLGLNTLFVFERR